MKYAILIFETPENSAWHNEADMGAYVAYTKTLMDAGVMTGGAGLQPRHTATSLRVKNGKRHVQDGPFPDTKEQLSGFYLIDAPDLDAALTWAAKCPGASIHGVEVRPLLTPPGQ